jgi:hypothetical protein
LLLPGADEKSYIRLRNEAMTAGSLRHPHLVRILQIGTAAQGRWLILRWSWSRG